MKIIKFYCDINGTFTSSNQDKREENLKLFCLNLRRLVQLEQADRLELTFTPDFINGNIAAKQREIYEYLDHSVSCFGKQIFYIDDTKKNKITIIMEDLINYQMHNIDDEVVAYFADDDCDNHYLLNHKINASFPNIRHIHFVLGNFKMYENEFTTTNREINIESLNEIFNRHFMKVVQPQKVKKC